MGPDDAVYVVDWYDRRASHLDPRDNWDKTNGRIYRVAPKATKAASKYDLAKESADQLIARLDGESAFFARQAREELLFRALDEPLVKRLQERLMDRQLSLDARLNRLWVLGSAGKINDKLAMELFQDSEPAIREWAIRFLGNEHHLTRPLADKLEELAESEKSPSVRLQLAASCRRWPAGMMLPIVDKLTARNEDLSDTMIPLTLWWTIQEPFLKSPEIFMQWLTGSAVRQRPVVGEIILPRLARMMVAQASSESFGNLWKLYQAGNAAEKAMISRELEQGAVLAAAANLPVPWRKLLEGETSPDAPLFRASLKFGIGQAAQRAGELVLDAKTADATRVALLQRMAAGKSAELGKVLTKILSDQSSSATVTAESLSAALQVNDPEIGRVIVRRYPKWSADLQTRAINTLVNRPESARLLLEMVQKNEVSKQKLTSAHAQAIDRLGDKELSAQLEKVWGRPLRPTSEARVKRIAEIRGILPEGDKGLAARGKAVFLKSCATCHQLFGDGMALGPELNGADRGNLDFLLTSIIDPSAQIRGEYQAVQVALKDGRVLLGLVADKNDAGMTLIDANRQLTRIAASEIEEVKASSVSLMPEGVLDTLKDNEIRDLFRYLQSPGPPK
jgi:putative heme-binding domain-containing protein